MNKKIIVFVMVSIFLLMGISSVSAINTKSIDAVNVSNDGGGHLMVIVRDIHGIPFLPPAGWAIEVTDDYGQVMDPNKKYEDGVAIYEPIPLGHYNIKVSANLYKNKYREAEITKEVIPGDPSTYVQISIKFTIRDIKTRSAQINPLLSVFHQLLVKVLSIR